MDVLHGRSAWEVLGKYCFVAQVASPDIHSKAALRTGSTYALR